VPVDVDPVEHVGDDVVAVEALADRQQHRVGREPEERTSQAGVHRELVGR